VAVVEEDADSREGNWKRFVEEFAGYRREGLTEEELSKNFRDRKVAWKGIVKSLDVEEEFAPCVVFRMSVEGIPLIDGRRLKVDHVVLSVTPGEAEQWKGCSVDDRVNFDAIISSGEDDYDEIQVDEWPDGKTLSLSLSLRDGVNESFRPEQKHANSSTPIACREDEAESHQDGRLSQTNHAVTDPPVRPTSTTRRNLDDVLEDLKSLTVDNLSVEDEGIARLESLCGEIDASSPDLRRPRRVCSQPR